MESAVETVGLSRLLRPTTTKVQVLENGGRGRGKASEEVYSVQRLEQVGRELRHVSEAVFGGTRSSSFSFLLLFVYFRRHPETDDERTSSSSRLVHPDPLATLCHCCSQCPPSAFCMLMWWYGQAETAKHEAEKEANLSEDEKAARQRRHQAAWMVQQWYRQVRTKWRL